MGTAMIATTEYQRAHGFECPSSHWLPPRKDGDILITADGFRWRIEGVRTVADIVHIGDRVWTNYGRGGSSRPGTVIAVSKEQYCTCPRDQWGTLLCHEHRGWGRPAITEYHQVVHVWNIVYVHPDEAKQDARGRFYDEADRFYIGDIVCFHGRLLHLFENNKDEVFVAEPALPLDSPMQLTLF